ncbi:MAG: formylmethanofuran dehydrogenase subunit C [Promethearchaeota archaeon]
MADVTLTLKRTTTAYYDAECITPDAFAGKSAKEVGEMPVWEGNRKLKLADVFDVAGEPGASAAETKIVVKGQAACVKRIGQGMTAGEIVVEGDAGMHCGAKMKGGKVTVKGNADDWAGAMMEGGELHVEGNAANFCGAAYRGEWVGMKDGLIVVDGTVGHDAMAWARNSKNLGRWPKLVCSGAGMFLGIHSHGGTIVVKKTDRSPDPIVGRRCGADMARGVIVLEGRPELMLPSFVKEADETDPELPNGEKLQGTYEVWRGDLAVGLKTPGKIYVKK